MESSWVEHGDCREVMAEMPEASIDAIVTDPPYGLEFMGKEWDSFRASNSGIQKSGFGRLGQHGTPSFAPNRRNQKCPACGKWAYDHAGRKCECGGWKQPAARMYSQAFQEWSQSWAVEALRVLKPGGHLLAFGGTRTFHRLTCALEDAGFEIRDCLMWLYGSGFPKSLDVSKAIDKAARGAMVRDGNDITAPATDAARQWSGWGTALKPAWEPIILARKPLARTVAANVQEHGTGALNVDGCRIAGDVPQTTQGVNFSGRSYRVANVAQLSKPSEFGRWPANLVLDEEAARLLDEQSGASRFFYAAKVSGGERHYAGRNTHPTVKPVDLMRWLCRLVTPPGGLVLDPFMGSGSTGIAALAEGLRFVGIEKDAESVDIARKRIVGPLFAAR